MAQSPEQTFAAAVAEYQQGRLAEAESALLAIQDSQPDLPDVLHLLAMIALRTERPADAAGHLEKAIAAVPGSADLHDLLGGALKRMGRTKDAVAAFERSIALDPGRAETHYNLGNTLKDLERPDDAIACYQRTVALVPDFADAHYNLGAVLNSSDRPEEAIEAFQHAIRLNPGDADAHRNLANALQNLRRFEDSIGHYEKSLALKPGDPDLYYDLARSLRRVERFEDAIAAYRRADKPLMVLRCLYMMGAEGRFYDELERFMETSDVDREAAAVSAFAAHQFGREDPYPFCRDPLNFVKVYDSRGPQGEYEDDLERLSRYLAETAFEGEDSPGSITEGFKSSDNLFDHGDDSIGALRGIVDGCIRAYRDDYASDGCHLVKFWPRAYRLDGWFIRMRKGGQIEPHNHAVGWLSGVMYLKMPQSDVDGGGIEFGLYGFNLPILDPDYPRKLYPVNTGDLILFPSSLFHRVLPTTSDEERLSLAFDIIPA